MSIDELIGIYKNGVTDRGGCGGPVMVACMVAAFMVVGCRTVKNSVEEKTDTSDSVRIEYIEKIVKVPVTVSVEVPAEKKERETTDTISTLETSFAFSMAAIKWNDGIPMLFHSLENKPQKIEKTDSVPVKEKLKVVWKTRRVTYTKKVEVEKELGRWDRFKIDYGGFAVAFLALLLLWKACRIARRFGMKIPI